MYEPSMIAERIKLVAKRNKVQILDMLNECGLSKNTLSSMLSGGSTPKSENLARIADRLDCSVDFLLGRIDKPEDGDFVDILQNIDNIISNTNLTLTQIENDCGFSKSSMRKWSENLPSIDKVIRVAQRLNVSIDFLLTGTNSHHPAHEQQLLGAYRAANEGIRISVDKLLDISENK